VRCTILAIGSRGDVQPLIALGSGLKAAGVDVRLATHVDFATAVAAQGLEFFPLEGHASAFFSGAAGSAFRDRVRRPEDFRRLFDNYLSLFLTKFLKGAWQASADADVVLSWSRCAPALAERLRVPVFVVALNPVLHLPTFTFPNPFQGPTRLRLGPLFNRWSWRLAVPATRIGEQQVSRWRQETLGLPPLDWRADLRQLRRLPHLLGYSTSVLPRPFDWPSGIHVTGYWFLDAPDDYVPNAALQTFLDAGKPPVAIGFSSQVGRNTAAITRTVVDAVTAADVRALLVTGFGGLKGVEFPARIFPVQTVPYEWMLPRVSAIVHHGGAGSTASALRFGVPNGAVTFGFDQQLWGERVHALRAGPAPLPATQLTVEALSRTLRQLTSNPKMRAMAQAASRRIRSEDGVSAAVSTILAAVTRRSFGATRRVTAG
jgi:sterol 3beta-glucosyltransferase